MGDNRNEESLWKLSRNLFLRIKFKKKNTFREGHKWTSRGKSLSARGLRMTVASHFPWEVYVWPSRKVFRGADTLAFHESCNSIRREIYFPRRVKEPSRKVFSRKPSAAGCSSFRDFSPKNPSIPAIFHPFRQDFLF